MNWSYINSIKDLVEREKVIREELVKDELNDLISYCQTQVKTAYNNEQAIKIQLNSSYGAIASQYFIAFNTAVAEAITLQGQDLIKYADKVLNDYFHKVWHLDKALHEQLGVTNVKLIEEQIDVVCYADTDSAFLNFGAILKSCTYQRDEVDLINDIYNLRLKAYLKKCFEIYAEKRNTVSIQEFELENISQSVIFLAKKKYISDIVWRDPGIRNASLEKIKHKGVEIVQGSTPIFARGKLKELVKYIFVHNEKFAIADFNKEIKKIKEEFLLTSIEEISKGSSVGDYEKYILSDRKELTVASKCPAHIRACGLYNLKLNSSKWKDKYRDIKTGDKVKFYPTTNGGAFAFHPNSYPAEFADPIDYDTHFSKTIIDPINRIVVACGWTPIKSNLVTFEELF